MTLDILNIFSNTPIIWPDAKPLDLDNSYIWSMDKNLKYLPIGDTTTSSDSMGWIFVIFLLIWGVLFYLRIVYHKLTPVPLIWGFLVGVILFYGKHILYGLEINVLHPVREPTPSIKLINSPNVIDYNNTNKNTSIQDHLSYLPGDWKILLENKVFPKSEKDGYLMSARTYLNYEKNGKIKGEDLATFLEEDSCPTCVGYDQDNQNQSIPFPQRLGNVETLAFYLGILILTFAIYISDVNTKYFKIIHHKIFVFWIILVLLITTISSALGIMVPGLQNIASLEDLVDFKENLAIIAISFAVTTVLIV